LSKIVTRLIDTTVEMQNVSGGVFLSVVQPWIDMFVLVETSAGADLTDDLLLENGDFFLLENGSKLLLG
jgi:hypothetical protein